MPIGNFVNETLSSCTAPLLDQSLFGSTGGYQPGRYCGLGSFEDGTTCCFPCPIQDWLYPPEWKQQLRVPNYLSILSVILCSFLLLSFAVLPPSQTHRHYLSVGLLFPVLFVSLSFVIPVGIDPPTCYDAITPNDMRSSLSCAWTGSLVTLGGLGCVVWVFLRSLWLHIRIFWDRDPGRYFKYGSIIAGTMLPLSFLIALLTATGFSYRMGQTCLPNHEHAIVTFWVWLVVFAIAGFLLQVVTTGYCVYVYMRTLRRERASITSFQRRGFAAKLETWTNVKKLFLLQWRNILVSVLVIIGSISFFIVFWTQDGKLGRVFNDPANIKPVKTWIICQTLSRGDKEECRKYVKDFTVPRAAVLTSLILASLVGIEIFILLFRRTMLQAWLDLFARLFKRVRGERPPTPQLTSLDNPDKLLAPSIGTKYPGFVSTSSADKSTRVPSSNTRSSEDVELEEDKRVILSVADSEDIRASVTSEVLRDLPGFDRVTSETGLLAGPPRFQSFFEGRSSMGVSRSETPTPLPIQPVTLLPIGTARSDQRESFTPQRPAPTPPTRPRSAATVLPSFSRPMPNKALERSSLLPQRTHYHTGTALSLSQSNVPFPSKTTTSSPNSPSKSKPTLTSTLGSRLARSDRTEDVDGDKIPRSRSGKRPKSRISTPVPGTFVHVGGAFMGDIEVKGSLGIDTRGSLLGKWENE